MLKPATLGHLEPGDRFLRDANAVFPDMEHEVREPTSDSLVNLCHRENLVIAVVVQTSEVTALQRSTQVWKIEGMQ